MEQEQYGSAMISATSSFDGPAFTVNVTVNGLAVYLDNWAVIDLAEGDPSRRKRFVEAVRTGGDLLFSVANAAQLAGSQGESADAVRAFLDDLGPHWFPVELNIIEVINREQKGKSLAESCASEEFMKDYLRYRMRDYLPTSGKIINLSDDFFRLGAVLDWVGPQRESIHKSSVEFDAVLKEKMCKNRPEYKRNSLWLAQKFRVFNPSQRATFTFGNLVRTLIIESNELKAGDGFDLCHAIMGSAFASIAALDKNWKRRVDGIPKPNGLAHIYSPLQLDTMVADIELCVKQKPASPLGNDGAEVMIQIVNGLKG
jgi:hypothetical protein